MNPGSPAAYLQTAQHWGRRRRARWRSPAGGNLASVVGRDLLFEPPLRPRPPPFPGPSPRGPVQSAAAPSPPTAPGTPGAAPIRKKTKLEHHERGVVKFKKKVEKIMYKVVFLGPGGRAGPSRGPSGRRERWRRLEGGGWEAAVRVGS